MKNCNHCLLLNITRPMDYMGDRFLCYVIFSIEMLSFLYITQLSTYRRNSRNMPFTRDERPEYRCKQRHSHVYSHRQCRHQRKP